MDDIFTNDGGGGGQFLSWNARDHFWKIGDVTVDLAELYIDAQSFRNGWADTDSDPKIFIYAEALGETLDKPSDNYKNVWRVDAYVPDYGDMPFSWFSWSVLNVFRPLYKKIKDQPAGQMSKFEVTSDLVKDARGNAGPGLKFIGFVDRNAGPGLKFIGFVDRPDDSAPAPAAAADQDTVF